MILLCHVTHEVSAMSANAMLFIGLDSLSFSDNCKIHTIRDPLFIMTSQNRLQTQSV